jgi:hypothetical protein
LCLPLTLLAACIVPAPTEGRGEAPAPGKAATAQPLAVKSGALFGGQVELLGATVSPAQPAPGESAKVTAYYQVNGELDRDWHVFVHIEDPDGRVERMNADHAPVGGARPTSTWKIGERLRDEYVVQVPATPGLRALSLWTGFWHPGTDARLPVQNAGQVRTDGKDRVLLVTLPIGR